MAQNELHADGKRYGIVIADYLLEPIRVSKLTPAVVVDFIGTNVHKHANEMLAEGRSKEDVAAWVQTVRHAFQERMMAELKRAS